MIMPISVVVSDETRWVRSRRACHVQSADGPLCDPSESLPRELSAGGESSTCLLACLLACSRRVPSSVLLSCTVLQLVQVLLHLHGRSNLYHRQPPLHDIVASRLTQSQQRKHLTRPAVSASELGAVPLHACSEISTTTPPRCIPILDSHIALSSFSSEQITTLSDLSPIV